MKAKLYIPIVLITIIFIGFFSYSYFPKRTELICNNFNGYRKGANNTTLDWKINVIRVSLINSTFSIKQYSNSMDSYLVDSSTVRNILKNTNNSIDATLEKSNVLNLFVPTPQSNYGMLSMRIDLITGEAHISTWEYAGGDGNGILNGKCEIINLTMLEKLYSGFASLIK